MAEFLLSPQQRRIWLLQENLGNTLVTKCCLKIGGLPDKDRVAAVLRNISLSRDVLRTEFSVRDELEFPLQVVPSPDDLSLSYHYFDRENSWSDEWIRELYEQDGEFSDFFSSRRPGIMYYLVKQSSSGYYLIIKALSLLLDGYSLQQLAESILTSLNKEKGGADDPYRPGSISYMQFAEWQQCNLEDDTITYWKDAGFQTLDNLLLQTEWTEKYLSPGSADAFFILPAALKEKLDIFINERQLTATQFFYACWTILLSRLSGSRQFVSGYIDYGKELEELQPVWGALAKTLPVRVSLGEAAGFQAVATALMQELTDMEDWKDYYLLENSRSKDRNNNQPAFIPYLFSFLDFRPDAETRQRFLPELIWFQNGFEKYKALLNVVHENGNYRIQLEFNSGYFSIEEANRMLRYFRHLIGEILAAPERPATELGMLDEAERHLLLDVFNRRALDIPESSLIELFESQVRRNEDIVAVVADDGMLTYGELNEEANRLANFLREKYQARPRELVAILTNRSTDMIKAMTGILKAGAAYLPLEASWPPARLAELLSESKCRMVIAQEDLAGQLPGDSDIEIISINDKLITTYDKTDPPIVNSRNDLAYVIFTSGSTGKPKGVMIDHETVINLCYGLQQESGSPEAPGTRFALFASVAFDASVQQIFGCLLGGNSLYIISDAVKKDIDMLTRFLQDNKIAIFDCTPAVLSLLLEEAAEEFRNTGVKKVLVGGDAWTDKLLRLFYKEGFDRSGITFYNVYGPTECGVDSTIYRLKEGDGLSVIPIGAPLPNKHIYILDNMGRPVPIGLSGEIFIGGKGISPGYLNRDDLSGELFISSPVNGERVYKSGDLGKWLPDGNIVFMGRKDEQLKIRGYRIEPAEVATALLGYEGVREAIVYLSEKEEGQKSLTAAIVPAHAPSKNENRADDKSLIGSIREYMAAKLPAYMLPADYFMVDKIPLNSSGKIDREALKKLEGSTKTIKEITAGPENEIEELLLRVWKEVLGRIDISVDDDFFMIGGDSIKAIQISSRLHKAGYKVTIRDILNHSILADLSPHVKMIKKAILQDEIRGVLPLVPAQRAFFARDRKFPGHFNLPMLFYSADRIDSDSIRSIFSRLWSHHDALRMVFSNKNGQWQQENKGTELSFDLKEYEFSGHNALSDIVQKEMETLQSSIDLEKGPLLKVGLFHASGGDRLLVIIHHLVTDGVSWRILFEDIETLLRQYRSGISSKLPDKTHSFKEWAENLAKYANGNELLQERNYWAAVEKEPVDYLDTGYSKDDNKMKDTAYAAYRLSDRDTSLLLTTANKVFNTRINDILLSALSISLRKAWGLSRVAITMEGHGREGILDGLDINRTVGWFTSLYPVVLYASHEKDLPEQIKEMKKQLNAIPNNGIGYGILKYLTDKKNVNGIDFRIEPEISFNYLGQFDEDTRQLTMEASEEPFGPPFNPDDNRDHLLDIVAKVSGKSLNFKICYNSRHFTEEKIREFGESYKATLHSVAEHCAVSGVTTLAPV